MPLMLLLASSMLVTADRPYNVDPSTLGIWLFCRKLAGVSNINSGGRAHAGYVKHALEGCRLQRFDGVVLEEAAAHELSVCCTAPHIERMLVWSLKFGMLVSPLSLRNLDDSRAGHASARTDRNASSKRWKNTFCGTDESWLNSRCLPDSAPHTLAIPYSVCRLERSLKTAPGSSCRALLFRLLQRVSRYSCGACAQIRQRGEAGEERSGQRGQSVVRQVAAVE